MTYRCMPIGMRLLVALTILWSGDRIHAQQANLDHLLAEAAWSGNAEKVVTLLKQGANPNATRTGGRTALHLASSNGHLKVIRLLIDHGADVHAKDRTGRTVLAEAAGSSEARTVKMLLGAGAKPDEFAMAHACWLGRIDSVKLLLDAGIHPDAGMVQAAQGRRVEILRLLLAKGGSVKAKSQNGNSPLHAAALQGGFETVDVLLEHGADPNALNDDARTPLHMAVAGDCELKTIKRLVEAGAKFDLPDKGGLTPVRLAAIGGEKPAYDWLVSAGGGKELTAARPAGPAAPERAQSTKELLAAITTKQYDLRLAAQRELVMRGKEVMPDVLSDIESGTGIEHYYDLFAALGPGAEGALPLLQTKLADKRHVLVAAITLNRIKPGAFGDLPADVRQRAAAALYEGITSPEGDEMTAGYGAAFLVSIGQSAAPTILQALRHDKSSVRALMAGELAAARFRDDRLEAELLQLLRPEESPAVRTAAAKALGRFGESSPEVRAALLAIVKSAPPNDAQVTDEKGQREVHQWRRLSDTAARSLTRFGSDIIDDLLPLLSPIDRPQRFPAMTALQSLGAPAVPRLVELLEHEDRAVAISASVALNRIGKPAVPALAKTVSTGTEQVSELAADALWWIGGNAGDALPTLWDVAGSDNRSDSVRLVAARAALKIDAPRSRESKAILSAQPALIRMLEKGNFQQRASAAETLGAIGPAARDALPQLRALLQLPNGNPDASGYSPYSVRLQAQKAIDAMKAATDVDAESVP